MSEFEFVDTLPVKMTRGRKPDPLLMDFAEALRQRPGVWAKYPRTLTTTGINGIAASINNPVSQRFTSAAFINGGFEAATRDRVLYVRYVGDEVAK